MERENAHPSEVTPTPPFEQQIQEKMYELFRETDAKRPQMLADIQRIAKLLGLTTTQIAVVWAQLCWSRLNDDNGMTREAIRDYISEMMVCLAITRHELDGV